MGEPTDALRLLRLCGGRFDDAGSGVAGFPLEIIGELARYERLLVQVARGLWMSEHPQRKRAPKRFDESLRLLLTAVEDGSVAPVLQRRESVSSARLFDPDRWIDKSQRTIADTIAAVVAKQPLPGDFPMAATSSLVQFGSALQADETCLLFRDGETEVQYTQSARRHLVAITSSEDIKIQGDLVGRISAFDANRQTFEFVDRLGHRVDGRFEQLSLLYAMKQATDRDPVAPFVRLSCRYSTDTQGYLSAIDDVDDLETVVAPDDPLGSKLRRLLELADDWCDGEGTAPHVDAIEWARDFAAEVADERRTALLAFPTLEGGVLLEQQVDDRRWSIEIDSVGDAFVLAVEADKPSQSFEPQDVTEAADSFSRFFE